MSLESIEQKSKAILEAYYEFEQLKIRNASKQDLDRQRNYIQSLAEGIKSDAAAEKE